MKQTVSITPKWQIHIPVAIRQALKLDKPSQAELILQDDGFLVRPKKSKILELGGSLANIKPTKRINLTRIRDYIDYSKW